MSDDKSTDVSKKCASTGKNLKRRKRYYRNGLFYVNKSAFKVHFKKLQEEAAQKAEEEAKKAEEEKAAAAQSSAPAEEAPAAEQPTENTQEQQSS